MKELQEWLNEYGPSVRTGAAVKNKAPNAQVMELVQRATTEANYAEGAASIVGDNTKNALQSDDDVRQNLPSSGSPGDSPAFIEAFAKAPATGCATLLDIARASAKWDPLKPEDPANVERFRDYVANIDANPLFHLTAADVTAYHKSSQDWNKVIEEIANLFEGVAEEDKSKIRQSLTNLAEAATSRSNTRQSKNLFAQNTLKTDTQKLQVYIYSSRVDFVENDGKSTTRQQDYQLIRVRFEFLLDAWNEITAAAVAKAHYKSLLDWLDRFTTKPGDKPNIPLRQWSLAATV